MTDFVAKQVFNVVSDNIILDCLEDFKSQTASAMPGFNVGTPRVHLDFFKEKIVNTIGRDLELCNNSSSYYSHEKPYLPHTDYNPRFNNELNVVIPLELNADANGASLVVFDQVWPYDGVVWCMHNPVIQEYGKVNIRVKGWPGEYPVTNKTKMGIDLDFWNKYLRHYPYDTLYNLSGNAYPYTPGSMILFNNSNVHCTSYFKGNKTGVTLRYRYV